MAEKKYLDRDGLAFLWSRIEDELGKKANQSSIPIVVIDTVQGWNGKQTYVPSKGEIVIYSNYSNDIANIKIGDGIHFVKDLPFISNANSSLQHTLTIGNVTFDGTEDVSVEVYGGEINEAQEEVTTFKMNIN